MEFCLVRVQIPLCEILPQPCRTYFNNSNIDDQLWLMDDIGWSGGEEPTQRESSSVFWGVLILNLVALSFFAAIPNLLSA